METVSVSKFKATCHAVLDEVNRKKKKVIITKHGKPIAEIVPVDYDSKDIPLKDTVTYMGDIVSPVAEYERVLK
jgi:prevent-host-death family protein